MSGRSFAALTLAVSAALIVAGLLMWSSENRLALSLAGTLIGIGIGLPLASLIGYCTGRWLL